MIQHSRKLAACTFANKTSVSAKTSGDITWQQAVDLHRKRRLRPHKDGVMFGGYALNGTRKDANVSHRSLIQLDIDTEVARDETTGEIAGITRAAPLLENIRAAIAEYEWLAASSHSHEPKRGINKYRVVMLPDRDILPDEHMPLLEALDRLLGGILDRGAWPFSQAFYLPSCPAENADDAFFVHNAGVPVPVDQLVALGRQNGSTQRRKTKRSASSQTITKMKETVESIGRVKSMLGAIPASVKYDPWRDVVWAIASTGWDCAEAMAREWSMSAPEKWDEKKFQGTWTSYDPNHKDAIQIDTLQHMATQNGWTEPTAQEAGPFDGKGGDVWNGKKFAEMYKHKLLNIHEKDEWLLCVPERGWAIAPPGEADRSAKNVIEALREEVYASFRDKPRVPNVFDKPKLAHIERSCKAPQVHAMISMAKSEPGMTVSLNAIDADPLLLGLANGVLDLRSRTLLSVSPDVLVTKRCAVAYDPEARCPRFIQFMKEVQPNLDVRRFLRRFMGYCLTGRVSEQKFMFFWGRGANGKSVFLEIFGWLLGDYAMKIATEMLMHHQRNPQGPSPDIVSLKGLRFTFANETEEGRRLADARLKDMTGGDTLTGRVPYGKAAITFQPTNKLVIAGNHKPDVADTSEGMWRRIVLVPFDQTIPANKRDKRLLATLKQEGSGILNWMLVGLQDWQMNGLQVPASIKKATEVYREDQDIIGEWLRERCLTGSGHTQNKGDLYLDYRWWAGDNGHHPVSQSKLTRRLNDRGYSVGKDKRTVNGVALKPPDKTKPLRNV